MNEAQLKEIILKTITEMVGEEGQGRASAAAPQVEPGDGPRPLRRGLPPGAGRARPRQ